MKKQKVRNLEKVKIIDLATTSTVPKTVIEKRILMAKRGKWNLIFRGNLNNSLIVELLQKRSLNK